MERSNPVPNSQQHSVIYNPTFSVQWPQWDTKHKCAFAAGHDLSVSDAVADGVGPLAVAVKYALCRGWKNLNALGQVDEIEALQEVLDLKTLGTNPIPQPAFVSFLADAAQWFHDRNIVTIFVAHSQGNLMLAQALAKRQFDELQTPSAHYCTAATSLAPPADPIDFTQYSWMNWNGFIVYHDILTFLPIGLTNASVDHVSSRASVDYDNKFVFPNVPTVFDKWHWGTMIHRVIPTYLTEKVSEFRPRVDAMVRTCINNPLRP